MSEIIDADTRELELLGHAPDDDHIPAPQAHRPTLHRHEAGHVRHGQRVVLAESDRSNGQAGGAWIAAAESDVREVRE